MFKVGEILTYENASFEVITEQTFDLDATPWMRLKKETSNKPILNYVKIITSNSKGYNKGDYGFIFDHEGIYLDCNYYFQQDLNNVLEELCQVK